MYIFCLIILIVLAPGDNYPEKVDSNTRNYSEFLNFGQKKSYEKVQRINLENSIIKSKVDILGAIFKQNIAIIKHNNTMDLVFLIDASSSVGQNNFNSELKFIKKLLSDVTVDYNHTRVAIITFSSQGQIIKNIDEITNPKLENNKCLLLNKELNNITYTGGGTYTLGAFKAAQEIFENSRVDAQKVLFLITDGYSNGGDPLPIAKQLKEAQVTIFTIGISNGNYRELYNLASSPGELHSYLLDSFEEFESLARHALHVDLQSGDYYPLGVSGPCDGLCETGNCCDTKAHCTCGTSTGQYSCLCEVGYYGSGLNNSCLPCPSGSYAQGPNLCLPCPDIHHYTEPPAVGIQSCKCKRGFKELSSDTSCEVISCPEFSAPENGYIVQGKKCNTALNSACGVRCNVGYTLFGKSIRLCREDGAWSGTTTCQIKTCSKLPTPPHGGIKCKHPDLKGNFTTSDGEFPVDTACHFKCTQGYTLIGSKIRTCLPLAQWDGLRSACKQIKCMKLSKINFGKIEPMSCTIGKQPYGRECKYSCMPGFELFGPTEKKCLDGTWDYQDEVTCKDTTKPEIECPQDIIQKTLPGKAYGLVTLPIIEATDNSGLNITIWSKPVIKGAHKFKIGTTQVTYYAQDVFGNKNKCSFNVTILDDEPPTIESCVDPPVFISNGPANVTWDEPNIFDNSLYVNVTRNKDFGEFPMGLTQVIYTAVDRNNNYNSCTLNITIENPQCPNFNEPVFASHKCSDTKEGVQCVITCDDGYALPLPDMGQNPIFDNTTQFFCDHHDPIWRNLEKLNSTECAAVELPTEITQNGTIETSVDTDLCNDKSKLIQLQESLEKSLALNTIETCDSLDCVIQTEPECHNNEIAITKRDVTSISSKGKSKRKRLNVKFQIRGRPRNKKKVAFLTSQRISGYNITTNSTEIRCPYGRIRRKFRCIKCPIGTFHNVTSNICQSCAIGSYNDKSGRPSCELCPENFSTRKFHAKSLIDCIEKCPPGSFAHKKYIKRNKNHENSVIERVTLKPYCSSCPLGTYQPLHGQTSCTFCPANTTTARRGAITIEECEEVQHPCTRSPCLHGKCIPESDYDYICQCDENYIGSNCEIFIHPCNSHPCQNDGKCSYEEKSSTNYKCTCAEGFSGPTCGLVVSQCDLACSNNGTCVMAEDESICLCQNGFGGKLCEDKIEKCKDNICQNNATCIEIEDEFKCICPKGYLGKRCQYLPCDFSPCNENYICVNEVVEYATENSYKCMCPLGFTGINCTEKINYCSTNPCSNNGSCISNLDGSTCKCPKGFEGIYCEIELLNNYILKFPRSGTTDFIAVDGFDDGLTQISVCFWINTKDSINYGTILSYANHKFNNAFTITDYTGVVIYINNEHQVTDVLLNDGTWHHFCLAWNNLDGEYNIYLDAKSVVNGTGLAKSQTILGNGKFIIGQEQDSFGGQFSQAESFLGQLAHLDVYNRTLTLDEVQNIMNNCADNTQGDVYAWSEFGQHLRGDITIETNTFCGECDPPNQPKFSSVNVIYNVAFYTCNKGYNLTNYLKGRKCLKANRWEGDDPQCLPISCDYPEYIPNGYFVGNDFKFNGQIVYKCNSGFNLTGKIVRTCNADGNWYPEAPECLGMHCGKASLNISRNSNITIFSSSEGESADFDKQDNFTVGTQLYVECINMELEGESTLTCMPNGEWDFEAPTCKLRHKNLPCNLEHIPEAPQNGYRDEDSYNEVVSGLSDSVKYSCKKGYKQVGGNSSSCIVDGYWSELKMKCLSITCKEPRDLTRFGVKLSDGKAEVYQIGHMLRYSCIEGYNTRGQLIARCIYPGIWSKINGFCIRQTCTKPIIRESTQIIDAHHVGTINATLTLLCNNETKVIKCRNGKWYGLDDYC